MTLNRTAINQGDTTYITTTLTISTPAELGDGHPLNPNGLLTAGYITRLIARLDLLTPKDAAPISIAGTPTSPIAAAFTIPPAATNAIDMGTALEVVLHYKIEAGDGVNEFTLEEGRIKLVRD